MKKGFFMALGVLLLGSSVGSSQTLLPPSEHAPNSLPTSLPPAKPAIEAAPKPVERPPSDTPISLPTAQTVAEPAPTSPILDAVPLDPGFGSGKQAEDRIDPLFTFSADYLFWWIRNGPVNGPLVTTGPKTDAIPGAIGQPGTRVLFGDELNYNPLSGLRLQSSINLGSGLSIEGGYFFFERGSVQSDNASDAAGYPLIARPAFNNQAGMQEAYGTAYPGAWAGHTEVSSHSALQGYEFNLAANVVQTGQNRLDMLVGFRSLSLNEDLAIQDGLTPLQPNTLTFLGAPTNPPDTLADYDKFHTRNNFYGGQVGARWETYFDRFSMILTGKVALGATQELATVEGGSVLSTPAGSTSVPGGILAQPSNIGRYYRSAFTAVPEVNLNFVYKLTPHLDANVGYTFLFWSSVARPGSQIDNNVNPALVPTDQNYGNGLGQNRPAFQMHSSSFSAQGLNVGLTYRY